MEKQVDVVDRQLVEVEVVVVKEVVEVPERLWAHELQNFGQTNEFQPLPIFAVF